MHLFAGLVAVRRILLAPNLDCEFLAAANNKNSVQARQTDVTRYAVYADELPVPKLGIIECFVDLVYVAVGFELVCVRKSPISDRSMYWSITASSSARTYKKIGRKDEERSTLAAWMILRHSPAILQETTFSDDRGQMKMLLPKPLESS